MQFETIFRTAQEKPVNVGLIGAGSFGLSLIAQSLRIRSLRVAAIVDQNQERVVAALAAMGIESVRTDSAAGAKKAMESGVVAICGSVGDLLTLPLDMVVEATGTPEYGAIHALAAIEAGVGVVMVSKEAECLVGPILAAKARARGVIYTLVEGDQPALLIGMISWARVLGLPIVVGGKSSESDYIWDPATDIVTWSNHRTSAPHLDRLWDLGPNTQSTLKNRAEALAELPQRAVPDLCEIAVVANATGLMPDRPDLHAPFARVVELPEIYAPRSEGGIIGAAGKLDVFNCFRRTDDASFAGGVFLVVEWADVNTGELFRFKGIPTSRDGRYGLVYNPSHLLGVEAPISILGAARLKHSILDESYRPIVDITACARRDLPAGTSLDIVGNRQSIPDLVPSLTPAKPLGDDNPLPYYMCIGRKLVRDVKKGQPITVGCVNVPKDSTLWHLRAEQDHLFLQE